MMERGMMERGMMEGGMMEGGMMERGMMERCKVESLASLAIRWSYNCSCILTIRNILHSAGENNIISTKLEDMGLILILI